MAKKRRQKPSQHRQRSPPKRDKAVKQETADDGESKPFRYMDLPSELRSQIIQRFMEAQSDGLNLGEAKANGRRWRVWIRHDNDPRIFEVDMYCHAVFVRLFVSHQFLDEAVEPFARTFHIDVECANFMEISFFIHENDFNTLRNRVLTRILSHACSLVIRVPFGDPQALSSVGLSQIATNLQEINICDEKLALEENADQIYLSLFAAHRKFGSSCRQISQFFDYPLTRQQLTDLKEHLIFPGGSQSVTSLQQDMIASSPFWSYWASDESRFSGKLNYYITVRFEVLLQHLPWRVTQECRAAMVIDLRSCRLIRVRVGS